MADVSNREALAALMHLSGELKAAMTEVGAAYKGRRWVSLTIRAGGRDPVNVNWSGAPKPTVLEPLLVEMLATAHEAIETKLRERCALIAAEEPTP